MCVNRELQLVIGAPYGSTLGPILFSIYIDNLGTCLDPSKVHLYVDDTIIYTKVFILICTNDSTFPTVFL